MVTQKCIYRTQISQIPQIICHTEITEITEIFILRN